MCVDALSRAVGLPNFFTDKQSAKKMGGVALLVLGIAMVLFAALFVSGGLAVFFKLSTSDMYFIASALNVCALIPLIVGAIFLSSKSSQI